MRDLIILGGGPAGVAAAIYAKRSGINPLMITLDIGGEVSLTSDIENVPGFKVVTGMDLSKKLLNHLQSFDVEIKYETINKIEKVENGFKVITNAGEHLARSIIIATGRKPRKLNVPGEEKLLGKGVSYCAVCDGFFFSGRTVAIVGGGNTAVTDALYMSKVAKKVYVIHRRDTFRADKVLVDRLKSSDNIELVLNSEVKEIIGENKVEGVILKDGRKLELDGVFIAIGEVPNAEPFKDLVKLNGYNEIITDKLQHTSVEGVFAAGDITDFPYKQIIIAEEQGAVAALEALKYIEKSK